MEEKKSIKISLSTFFLILAIIVIVIMGVFIFKFYNDKKVSDSEVKELESTINNLEGKINSLEETINDNGKNNDEITSKTFSNNEIKKALQDYLELKGIYAGSPGELLNKLGFEDLEIDDDIIIEDFYKKTNIRYEDYKNKMLNYMTEECLENNFTEFLGEANGDLYCFNGGASRISFEIESINEKGENYIANVYELDFEGTRSGEVKNFKFGIADYNGKCVISYCDN